MTTPRFLVDFFRVERHAAGEVGEREQALVDQARLVGGDLQHVHMVWSNDVCAFTCAPNRAPAVSK